MREKIQIVDEYFKINTHKKLQQGKLIRKREGGNNNNKERERRDEP